MLLVNALIVLPSAGLAGPPDPTWIDGIYDGADWDDIVSDVVSLVTDTFASTDLASYELKPPRPSFTSMLMRGIRTHEVSFLLKPFRGPPLHVLLQLFDFTANFLISFALPQSVHPRNVALSLERDA